MENFYRHIENLLSQHDYVVVPNLGGFIVQMQSARILSDRITPPHATIGFNALMNNSDGLLAIEVSRSEQISYRKAVEYIEGKVELIHDQLKMNGNIVIGDLGILQKNSQGSLTFNPIYKSGFLPQNLGLSDLYIASREVRQTKESVNRIIVFPSSKLLKYAAAAVIVVGVLVASPHINDMSNSTNYASLASLSFVNSFDGNEDQSLEVKVAESKPAEVKNTERPAIAEPLKVIETKVEIGNYHVIVASVPDRSSAQRLCDELVHEKFTEARVMPSSRTYRVAIQSFKSKEEADDFVQNLRKSDEKYESAWIFNN